MTHLLAHCPARLQPAFRAPFSGHITLTLTLVLTLPLTLTLSSLTCSNPNPNPLQPDLLVLSPGPGNPKDFDLSRTIDIALRRKLPIIGVCLGLQACS